MLRTVMPVLALLAALPAAALAQSNAPQLSLEHRMLLRCSAVFALVAHGQERGDPAALAHPPMAERGREFFVRSGARVMDEAAIDSTRLAEALRVEALDLVESGTVSEIMPVCLQLLDQSGY